MRGVRTMLLLSLAVFICVAIVYHDGLTAIKTNAQRLQVSIPADIQKEFSR